MSLPDFVLQALRASAKSGALFTLEVAAFGQKFSGPVRLPIRHEKDMNYCAGQSLRFDVRATIATSSKPVSGKPVSSKPVSRKPVSSKNSGAVLFEVMLFLSAKTPVFAWYCFDRHGVFIKAHFPLLAPNQWPQEVRQIVSRLQPMLERTGWQEVPFALLDLLAPNFVTDLDNRPATVFEALFAEII